MADPLEKHTPFDSVLRIVKQCCLVGISLETQLTDLNIARFDIEKTHFFQSMSTLFLYGNSLNMLLKIHSMKNDIKEVAVIKYQQPKHQISDQQINDTIKEISSILGGKIQGLFYDLSLEIQHSIPFVVEGFNNIFFQSHNNAFIDSFLISKNHFKLAISVEVERLSSSFPSVSEEKILLLLESKKNVFEFL